MTDVIEGEVVELEPRALTVVQQPGQALVASAGDPAGMVAVATQLANVLKDIVDKKHLYADIQGKRYPTVEAWMTIARLDNVVARESRPPVRQEDGAYEAFAELVRLSDGMVIGAASALCGGPDDEPWGGTPEKYGKPAKGPRPEHARRSMAVTRAISRAFRGQYSWIMALAGYEPTPAEEMPHEAPRTAQEPRNVTPPSDGARQGTAEIGKAPSDFELREQKTGGYGLSFRLASGGRSIKVICTDPIASALAAVKDSVVGQPVTCYGPVNQESFDKDGRTIKYDVLTLTRIVTDDFTLPAATTSTDPEIDGLVF